MFASKVAKPQTKAAADSTNRLTPQRSVFATRPFGGAVEQVHFRQRTIGNQATLRLLSQRGFSPTRVENSGDHEQGVAREDMVAQEEPRGVSWDFSKIPIYPPDRANRLEARSSFSTPPLPGIIQPKLAIGEVNDPLEHEADRVADQVMRMPAGRPLRQNGGTIRISRKCADCEEEERGRLQAKPVGATAVGTPAVAPSIVSDVARASGRPLDWATRAFFEPRFGADFSRVRLHTDAQADASARAVRAIAYTFGNNLVFREGAYDPTTLGGRRLIAHELTHVVQQTGSGGGHASANFLARQESPDDGSMRGALKHSSQIAAGIATPEEFQQLTCVISKGGCPQVLGGGSRKLRISTGLTRNVIRSSVTPWPMQRRPLNNAQN
jgi:hypothetical protein